MTIKKTNGHWLVDIEPIKGKRYRKKFTTKPEALRFEASKRLEINGKKAWNPQKDNRKLLELIKLWYSLHGQTLRDAKRRQRKLNVLAHVLGNPIAQKLNPTKYIEKRTIRLAAGISPKTLNNELGYMRSVFNELINLGHLDYLNPLKTVKPLKYHQHDLSYLTDNQITELLHSISDGCHNPHAYPITLICLSTGARWSEAENISTTAIQNNVITFTNTKNGKNRSVPINSSLSESLQAHWHKYGPFTGSITSFRRALARTSITLPKGQASHVLRHTFASHFIQKGGNILSLQKILGHSTLTMTMRYAHLAPDHLVEAIKYNPLTLSTL